MTAPEFYLGNEEEEDDEKEEGGKEEEGEEEKKKQRLTFCLLIIYDGKHSEDGVGRLAFVLAQSAIQTHFANRISPSFYGVHFSRLLNSPVRFLANYFAAGNLSTVRG